MAPKPLCGSDRNGGLVECGGRMNTFEDQMKEYFREDCLDDPWWCEVRWKSFIDRHPQVQNELAFWEFWSSTAALVFTAPFLAFELPFSLMVYTIWPETTPPLKEPDFEEDSIWATWTFF